MKLCLKCGVLKHETDFYIKDSVSSKRHTQCKDCYKARRKITYHEHYSKYREEYRERAKNRRRLLRATYRTNMLNYLKEQACSICGETDIRTFEFDHINPSTKSFNISQAVKLDRSWDDVLKEIEKCRILCANCHKKTTSIQAGWYKNL